MTKTVLIFHGSYGTPFENWIPSTAAAVVRPDVLALPVALPTPESQTFDAWASIVDGYRDAGLLTANSVVIAHSSSTSFVVRYVAARRQEVHAMITVAGFTAFVSGNGAFDEINAAVGVADELDFQEVRRLVTERHAFISDNDPNLPESVLRRFVDLLDAEVVVVPGAGHFNASSGYNNFSQLDDLAKRILSE